MKRCTFEMADECHALLKSFCALKSISVQKHVYGLIADDFEEQVRTDPVVKQMFLSGDYPEGSNAAYLKRKFTNVGMQRSKV